jgi:hypothetical protein
LIGTFRRTVATLATSAVSIGLLVIPATAARALPLPGDDDIVSMRTRYAKTYAGSVAGTYRSVIHAKPIHYLDASGAWRDIDTTLVPGLDGTFHNAADDIGITVDPAALSGEPLVSVDLGDGLAVGYGVSGAAAVSAVPVGNSISLPGVLANTTLDVVSRETSVKDDIVLTSAAAASDVEFPLYLNGLTATIDDDGNVVYRDLNGVERARTPHADMTDSAIDPHSGDGAMSDAVTYTLVQTGPTGLALRVSADRAWLDDPARQYPVHIDPTVYTGGTDDLFVEYPYNNDYSSDVLLKDGTFNGGTNKARSFIHFQGADALDDKVINSATIQVYENWSYSCTASQVDLYQVTQSWGAGLHAYPGFSLGTRIDYDVSAHGYTASCDNAWVTFTATTAMRNWASDAWQNYGVGLRAPDENDSFQWKKWDSANTANDPKLTVDWSEPNRAPGRPAGRTVGGNTCGTCTQPITADATPALTGNTTDADGDTLEYFFEVYPGWLSSVDGSGNATVSGVTAAATGHTAYVASGTTGTWNTSPALADGKYSYRVKAYDGALYGVWSAGWVNFTVDATAPATSVSSSTHLSQSTWYVENDPLMSFSATSESGIKGYSYVLDQVSTTVPDTTSEGTATTKGYTGLADGVWYFHVRAQNNANVWGTTTTYTIRVDSTAPPVPGGLTADHTPNLISTNAAVQASWNAVTDAASGLAGYSYEFNGSQTSAADTVVDTTATSAGSGTLADGTWWFHVRAVDVAGNASDDTAYGPFLIDAAIPAAPAITSATSSTAWTTSRAVSFSWSAPSDPFGIAGYSVVFDQNPNTAVTAVVTTTGLTDNRSNVADGVWYLHVAAVNTAGTLGATSTYQVLIDATTPAAPGLASSTHPNTSAWYTATTATVTASASAVSGIVGYAVSRDQVAGGDPGQSVTTSLPATTYTGLGNGTWYVHVRAVSGSGLVSGVTTFPLHVDAAALATPAVSATAPSTSWTTNRTVTFSWPAPTSVSGVAGYAKAFDQNPSTVLSHTVNTTSTTDTRSGITDGLWYLHVAAVNNAGTWSLDTTYPVKIDATVPAAPALSSSSHPLQSRWYPATAGSVSAGASAVSGIAGFAYSLDHASTGDPGQAVTSASASYPFAGLTDGTWYLHARAVSGSGLVSPVATYTLNVDATLPTAPALTSATHEPNVMTNHRVVTVDWSDAPSTDATSGIAGYSTAVNADSATPADALVDVTGTSFTSGSLADGTYWFHVRALDAAGNAGADVTFGPVVIDATHGLPYPVPDVLAVAGDGTATVTWSPVDSNGSPVLGYTVTADPDGATLDLGPTALSATFSGLENGTAYGFTVTAHNANGDSSPSDPSVDVVPAGDVGAPSGVVAEEVPNAYAVHVSWLLPEQNGNGTVTFTVVLNPGDIRRTVDLVNDEGDDGLGVVPSNETTFTGLTPGTYTAQVIATGENGSSATSDPSDPVLVQGTVPNAPTQLTAVPGDEEVDLSWAPAVDNGSPVTQYEVVNENDGSTQYVDGSDTSVTMTQLSNATAYAFDVYATNELGRGNSFARTTATPVDTGVPNASSALAPSNVRATRGDHSAHVSWTPPTASVGGVTEYRVQAHRASNDAVVATTNTTATSVTVTGLTNGVKVYFTVATQVGPANGPESNRSNQVTPAGKPFAPTNLSASSLDSAIRLTWTRPSDNGDPIRNYLVQIYSSSGSFLSERKVGSSPQKITGLTYGSSYYFTVKAQNGVGVGSASAASNTVTFRGVPLAPGSPTASQETSTSMRASWTASTTRGTPVTGYVVTAEPGGRSVTVSSSATTGVVTGLKLGTTYRLHIAATSALGRSKEAVTPAVTLVGPPGPPTNVKASAGPQRVTVSWTGANAHGSAVRSYALYNEDSSVTKVVSGSTRSYTFTGLTAGHTYTFSIYATNDVGSSSTVTANGATPTTAQSAPPPQPPSSGGGSASTVRKRIANRGLSQDQSNGHNKEHEWPNGGNCTWFSYHRPGSQANHTTGDNGKPCEADQKAPTTTEPHTTWSEYWCADFAYWVYQQEGINVSGVNGLASSFRNWAQSHGSWHAWGSGYTPQVGDAIVWGGHVGIVVQVFGNGDVISVNGNSGLDRDNVGSTDVDTHKNAYRSSGYRGRQGFLGFASPVDNQGRVIR